MRELREARERSESAVTTIVVTTKDKRDCAKRELAMRKRVYPRFVEQKRMSEGKAELEIAIMEAIFKDYEAQAEHEAEKERLI